MNPSVSIIVPVYNAEATIADTVGSILGQSCPDFELLLVDDGSTDGCIRICRRFEAADPRVRVLSMEHRGVSAARNKGLGEAKGEYIAFVDADDLLAPQYLERLLEGFRDEHVVLSMCRYRRIRAGEELPRAKKGGSRLFPASQAVERLLRDHFPIGTCAELYKREKLGALRFPEGVCNNEDKHFLFHFLLANEQGTVSCSDEELYGYRVRDGSATRSGRDFSSDIVWVADQIADHAEQTHPVWKELADYQRLALRLGALKCKLTTVGKDRAYERLRDEVLSSPFPARGDLRVKIEYAALRAGDFWHELLVRSYYRLVSEEMRFRTNEKRTRRG